jgi:hypothetical protein
MKRLILILLIPMTILKQFLSWFKWYYFDTKKCHHEPGPWHMREMGMGKIRWCRICGKCMNLI